MKTNYTLILYSGLTILMWGFWGFFGKLALERKMFPITIFFAEVIVSVFCSLVLFLLILPKQNIIALYNSWNLFGLFSGAGLAIGLLFYYFALNEAQATIIVPLTATYPVVSAFLSFTILGERPKGIQWIGIFLVVIGIALLLSGPVAKVSPSLSKKPDVSSIPKVGQE